MTKDHTKLIDAIVTYFFLGWLLIVTAMGIVDKYPWIADMLTPFSGG